MSPSCRQSLLAANVGADTADRASPICRSTIQVHRWLPNSRLARARSPAKRTRPRPASACIKLPTRLRRRPASARTPRKSISRPPTSSCFPRRPANRSARYLVSHGLIDQPVEVDGRTYDLALRFKRIYHPYTLTLKDFASIATPAPTRRRIIPRWSSSKTRRTTSIAKC